MNQETEIFEQAESILDSCGRIHAGGDRFVDLVHTIPVHCSDFLNTAPATPQQIRVQNNSNALFLVKGVVIQSPLSVRIKWPSNHYFSQKPSHSSVTPAGNTAGVGANMFALNAWEPIEPGAKIAVEMSGTATGLLDVQFWGVLRYFMQAKSGQANSVQLIDDPIEELERRSRYRCGPPQNIMAPEWLLGNQCNSETPAGYQDEPFTFFSPDIVVPLGTQVFDVKVPIQGGHDVIVRRVRALSDYSQLGEGAGAIPVFSMRLPNGYSLTGGDMIPARDLFWWPWVPSVKISPGQRIIIDMADTQNTGEGSITTKFEFDGIKRKKVL